MGMTSALYSALTGLNASQQRLDVSGNNIANVNTVAYKSSRAMFQTQLSQTVTGGTPPSDVSGGTNPIQFGLGTMLGAVQKDMNGGSIETTGINTDMAIQGNGFFMLQDPSSGTVYTRDGSFTRDPNGRLVSSDGYYVMGYPVDDQFNIQTVAPTSISIPLGSLTIAEATTKANFGGTLNSGGTIAATPGMALSQALVSQSAGTPATAATTLTDLASAAAPGVSLLAEGDVITLNVSKNSRSLEPATFTVTNAATGELDSGATVGELMEWIQTHAGIDTTAPQATPAGVTIGADGRINVVSNLGPDNSIDLTMTNSGANPNPLLWSSTAGDGSSYHTSYLVYDSLGNPVNVDVTVVLESKSNGTTWRFFAESGGDSDPSPYLGTGTITFDTVGNYVSSTGTDLTINRTNEGSVDPLAFKMDFSQVQSLTTGSPGASSAVVQSRDGCSAGTLNDFSVGSNGVIMGTFTNGLSRSLGQVVLANFSNPQGLISEGDNNYRVGPNSGEPAITTPGRLGAGTLSGGALELSNVDLTKEFVNMVTATTAFSASGKVISTSTQMLSELLSIMR